MSLDAEWETAKPDLTSEWDKAGPPAPAAPASSGGSPARAGMVNFAAGVAGLPMDLTQAIYNLPKAAYGVAKHELTGSTDLPELVTGTPGGSESIKRVLKMASEMSGIEALNPENPTPESKSGTLAYNLASKGAMIPGMALPAVASEIAGRTLGHQYEPLAALTPSAATSAYNAARAPTLALQQAQNVTNDATLKAAQERGYVVPPSSVNPTSVGNTIETLAGKSAMKQQAELKNQQTTNALVREELKVPENTPITEGLLTKLRDQSAEPYRQVRELISSANAPAPRQYTWMSFNERARGEPTPAPRKGVTIEHGEPQMTPAGLPQLQSTRVGPLAETGVRAPGTAVARPRSQLESDETYSEWTQVPLEPQAKRGIPSLEDLKQTRFYANAFWKRFDRDGDPAALAMAKNLDRQSTRLESIFEEMARDAGQPNLINELRSARTYIAKTYDIERALNLGNGNVDAQIIGRVLDRGRPLSGNLELIAKFAEGPGRQFVREASKVPEPGVSSKLTFPLAVGLGFEGYRNLGSTGAALAGIPFAGGAARSFMLSKPGQASFGTPSYDPALQPQKPLPALIQQGVLSQ